MKQLYTTILVLGILFISNVSFGQCIDNSHSPFADQGWESCNTSLSIIPSRGDRHWLMYDFGDFYKVTDLYVWNHNVWGETGRGAKSIIIDYSLDMTNWQTAGPFDIDKAPGSWKYQGNDGFSVGGLDCRYMLITIIDTWDEDSPCAGIGELKIEVDQFTSTEEEIFEQNQLELYPNPTADFLTISLEGGVDVSEISIHNTMGQKVRSLPRPAGNKITIPVDDLTTGVYNVSIRNGDKSLSKSFVKQ